MNRRLLIQLLLAVVTAAGCATLQRDRLDDSLGQASARDRASTPLAPAARALWDEAQTVLAQRCVVCHACYDAPCQLNLSAPEGIARGASKEIVYDGARLVTAQLTRLFDDALTPEAWRDKGFFPVLNERLQIPSANLQAGLMARLLELKHAQSSAPGAAVPDVDRAYQCPTIEEFEGYAAATPQRGMPFGMTALADDEYRALIGWLGAGAPMAAPDPLPSAVTHEVRDWERLLNGADQRSQLASRYLYEHLFLASLYLEELTPQGQVPDHWFRLVRSRTPPGTPIDLIATRRPFDDPGVARVYYRLQPWRATRVAKTHMPYALNKQRRAKWRRWFYDADYEVTHTASYAPEIAANPFTAFAQIPLRSRYRFLLDEAQYTIMGFIKGPVCRGQVALNVIDDRFWVYFADPDSFLIESEEDFLSREQMNLRLPAEEGAAPGGVVNWLKYDALQRRYLESKATWLHEALAGTGRVDTRLVWDGDGRNPNAALTVFRHFDSATVVKGLVGEPPKTAWIIGYALLERIHYLLVAGFDVYGNLGHQLSTRLYMDFLRMEGEANFLGLLPPEVRLRERDHWYRDAGRNRGYLFGDQFDPGIRSAIHYRSDDPKRELFDLLRHRVGGALATDAEIAPDGPDAAALARLASIPGAAASLLPEASLLGVVDGDRVRLYSLLVDRGFSSVSHLLAESAFRIPEEDRLTVARGAALAYPNAFYLVDRGELAAFVEGVGRLADQDDLAALDARFRIARNDPRLWAVSDALHQAWRERAPIEAAMFDFNRLNAD